jgi:hypothetical protein
VDQRHARCGGARCYVLGPITVETKGMLGLVLGLVHGRVGGGVDNKVRPKARYGSSEHGAVDEINSRAPSDSNSVTAGHARAAEPLLFGA